MPELSHLETWFSYDRLTPYRTAARDRRDAVALYAWNAEVSAAFWRTLGHVEVLVRNALHRELTAWSRQRHHTDRWYAAIDPLVSDQTRRDIREAIRRGTRNGRAETPGRESAMDSAQSYLSFSAFSRNGLIRQLSSQAGEGYPKDVATDAVDRLKIDWNQQAVKSAQQYLDMTSFSCSGLIQQLSSSAGEGFSKAQATYGAHQTPACK